MNPGRLSRDAWQRRRWWAHFEFTRINIEPIILRKKIEDLHEARATSLDAAAFSGIANWLAVL